MPYTILTVMKWWAFPRSGMLHHR